MTPDVTRILERLAAAMLADVGGEVGETYRISNAFLVNRLVVMAAMEFDRAADLIAQENEELRGLLGTALTDLSDGDLRSRVVAAIKSVPDSLRFESLRKDNDLLLSLLIDVHTAVEESSDSASSNVNDAIWHFLTVQAEVRITPSGL